MLRLNTIRSQPGATTTKKRLGRGQGSGLGATAGKGDKGQKARTGGTVRPGFEGGQTPLYRRLPKRGFTNPGKRSHAIFNLSQLERLDAKLFKEISLESLIAQNAIKGRFDRLSVLGSGDVTKAFSVRAHKVSPSAREKIEKAGGKVELIKVPGAKPRKKKNAKK